MTQSFSGLSNSSVLRAELRRLFRWLKGNGVTAIITAERGDATLSRFGLEDYVADCVIVLDHRVDEAATRSCPSPRWNSGTKPAPRASRTAWPPSTR
jgi:circadian clock protein KaiC